MEASEVEEAADDIIDEVTQEIEAEFKKKKKKKRRKKMGADSDDEDAYEEVSDDEEEPTTLDDVKDDENDKFEVYYPQIRMYISIAYDIYLIYRITLMIFMLN